MTPSVSLTLLYPAPLAREILLGRIELVSFSKLLIEKVLPLNDRSKERLLLGKAALKHRGGVEIGDAPAGIDGLIHKGLSERRVVHLVVTPTSKTNQIDDDVFPGKIAKK